MSGVGRAGPTRTSGTPGTVAAAGAGAATAVRVATAADAVGIRALPGLAESTLRSLDRDLSRGVWSDPRAPAVVAAVTDPVTAPADADPATTQVIASRADVVIGAAFGLLQVDEGHVLDIAVVPEQRRRGVGTALMVALDAALRARGAAALTLEVRTGNLGAQGLYRHLGFTVEGRRPGYYPDGEDALLMWRRAVFEHGGG
ncbi:MAG: GNAT family N-acetyltransferase [Nitriliruptoraceae bacterium]